jgi:hypothetical protein
MAKAETLGVQLTLSRAEAKYLWALTGAQTGATTMAIAGDSGDRLNSAIYVALRDMSEMEWD